MNDLLIASAASGIFALAGTALGALLSRSHGKELERDRFRHDIARDTSSKRLAVYVDLASRGAAAYRAKANKSDRADATLDEAKNCLYDNRFFFSASMSKSARTLFSTLSESPFDKSRAEAALNGFFEAARADLLLDDLSASINRAVGKTEPQAKNTEPQAKNGGG